MTSKASKLLKAQLKLLQPVLLSAGVAGARKAQDELGKLGASVAGRKVSFDEISIGEITGCFATPADCRRPDEKVILYIHGGGYTAGTLNYAKGFGSVLAAATGVKVFCAAYRLAPEHQFPCAVDDALESYRFLLAQGYTPENILFCGESAGGGLIYCLTLRLKQLGLELPAALAALSPWVDLTLSGKSHITNAGSDPSLSDEQLTMYADMYAPDSKRDPQASPVFGDLSGFPPSLIIVGGDEILLDDSRMLADGLSRAGSEVTLQITPEMWHVFPLYGTPEARAAISRLTAFIRDRLRLISI